MSRVRKTWWCGRDVLVLLDARRAGLTSSYLEGVRPSWYRVCGADLAHYPCPSRSGTQLSSLSISPQFSSNALKRKR